MSRDNDPSDELSARVPADVDRPDKLLAGLTARQLAILAVTAAIAAALYTTTGNRLPIAVIAALEFAVIAAGVVVALGRRDGLGLDRYLLAAVAHLVRACRLVTAPEGVPDPPAWCRVRGRLPAPLKLPVRAIRLDGVMELTDGGTAVMLAASTMSFTLRTPAEQTGLVTAFSRLLNSLDAPVQILVRAQAVDLTALIEAIVDRAPALPHPALEQAAHEHAGYLTELGAARDLLSRQVLLIARDQAQPGMGIRARRGAARNASAHVALRRAEHIERTLTSIGIPARVLDADACVTVLADSLHDSADDSLDAADDVTDHDTDPETGRDDQVAGSADLEEATR